MEAIRRRRLEEQMAAKERLKSQQEQTMAGATVTSLPPRDKHAPPPKVKMFQPLPARVPTGAASASSSWQGASRDRPIVFGEASSLNTAPRSSNVNSTIATASSSYAQPTTARTAYSPFVPPSSRPVPLQNNDPFYRPPPSDVSMTLAPTFDGDDAAGGPTIDAQTRDRQIQDMMSNMVSVVDVPAAESTSTSIGGLKCKLLPHQVQGLAWMKEREKGRAKGGILADDMGLGKTVQTLALILANRPGTDSSTIDVALPPEASQRAFTKANSVAGDAPLPRQKLNSKTTLIIAPLAVIRQWEREVQEKTDAGLKVYVYHGSARTKTSTTFAKYDIVITTYTTAATEYTNHMAKIMADVAGPATTSAHQLRDDSDANSSSRSRDAAPDSDDSFTHRSPVKPKPKKKTGTQQKVPLFDFDWLRIVLDEAQNIKNRKAKCSLACFSLSQRSVSRWCLTGTPIQNDAYEMFSLIHFLRVAPFDDFSQFKAKIGEPLKSTNQNRVNWGMKRLCFVLQTIMLRRTKEGKTADGKPLLVLPTRTVELISLDFDSPEEKQFYEGLQERIRATMDEDAEREQRTGKKRSFVQTLILLLRLRQACSHPSLVTKSFKADADAIMTTSKAPDADKVTRPASKPRKKGEDRSDDESDDDFVDAATAVDDDDDGGLAALLSSMTVATRRCNQCHTVLPQAADSNFATDLCDKCDAASKRHSPRLFAAHSSSTKVAKMLSLLSDIRRKDRTEKTIVFSQFTTFLDVVEGHFKTHSFQYVRYDGSMRPQEREAALATIRDDPGTTIILISFKAGSTGLNLTCCSKVILMDLWWNPQIEEQAFDRSHRLGQTRDVTIYKLSIKDTVEERILLLQGKKRALAKAALEGSKFSKANKLDSKEIWFLFNGPE